MACPPLLNSVFLLGPLAVEIRLSNRNKETIPAAAREGSALPKDISAPVKLAFVLAWSVSALLLQKIIQLRPLPAILDQRNGILQPYGFNDGCRGVLFGVSSMIRLLSSSHH